MTADVTREPTGGQGLREAIGRAIWHTTSGRIDPWSTADAVLALPELAVLLADADNWRRATTGDPTQPEPLAMQARTLLARVRELEATVARVRELAEEYERRAALDADPSCLDARINQMAAARLRRTLTGEPQP